MAGQTPPPPRDRYRSAGMVFLALGIVKLVYGFTTGFRMIISPAGEGGTGNPLLDFLSIHSRELAFAVIIFYAASAAFCWAAGLGIFRRLRIATVLGTGYAVLQVAGIAFVHWIGFIAFVNAAFGLMVLTSLWIARTFDRHGVEASNV